MAKDPEKTAKDPEKTAKAADPAITQARADEAMDREAASLGITASKVHVGAGKGIKDPIAEAARHAGLIKKRVENRIKKAKKADLSPKQARKKLLTARLKTDRIYTPEQVRQFKFELRAIENDTWFEPKRRLDGKVNCVKAPKGQSNFEKIMNM